MNECFETIIDKREQKNRQLITVGLIQRVCRSRKSNWFNAQLAHTKFS